MLVLLLCLIFFHCVPGRSSSCSPGFDGSNCTRENIAFRRRTSQSSDYKDKTSGVFYKSYLAVDGNVNTDFNNGSCTHTDQQNDQSSWEVLLDHEIKSKDVQMVIYLRNIQGVRYKNFRIFIGGALCKTIKDLATTHETPPKRNPVNISDCTTPLSGSNVTIKAATGDLTLCEVQIWQCKDGYFGSCLKKCNCYNTSEVCNKTTGVCPISGCPNGTYGPDCQIVCPDRRYGKNCSGTCGRCRNSGPCNKKSGECSGGCEPGYRTSLCDTACRNSEPSKKMCGECDIGCEPGYRTPLCDTECEDGTHGTNCNGSCGMCNNSVACDKVDGTCPHGCLPGFLTSTCLTECEDGTYGNGCTESCGMCNNSVACDKVDGTCPHGCLPGFWTSTCLTECEDGTYGDNCTERCGMCNLSQCDKVNGTCLDGCLPGFLTDTCHKSILHGELETQSSAGVLAGITVFLLVVAAGVTVLVLWRKGFFRKEERYPMPEENIALDMADDNYYENLPVDIPTHNLLNNILSKRDENQFKEEYKLLRYGLASKYYEGSKPEHKKRNRFLELFPYDHSRVKLEPDGQDTWDYINASFVTCYRDEKVYIAAQGPKPVTVNDFWRMIWQQNVRTIVMVTRLVEKNKNKCHQYWPEDGKTLQCGQINIVSNGYKTRSDYTIRRLHVQRKDCEQRTVTQFHFTQWPDHDVPAASALVGFWKIFSAHHSHEADGPPVVHCSAGVGRTGTFIALDSLARQAEREKKVNVFMCVSKMRESRLNMVQTVEQYEFLYYALLEALKSSTSLYTGPQFEEKFGQESGYTVKQEQEIQQQYQALIDLSMMKDEVISDGSLPENVSKNRNPQVLADNRSRPYLAGSNNYIYAIILPSVSRPQHYIVTQTPLPDTTVDFWSLVYHHDCRFIVCLDDSQNASALYPDIDTSLQVAHFKLQTVTSDQAENWTHIEVQVRNSKKVKKNLDVFKFPVRRMESGGINTASLLHFIDVLHSCRLGAEEKILIHCLDGCLISGVFCSVMNVVSRLKLDNTVDIFLTIRELQAHRPQFVKSYEQYKLCYDVAKEVGSSNCLYMNN